MAVGDLLVAKGKVCPYCSVWKNRSEYSANKRTKDGLGYCCKECHSAYCRRKYHEDPEFRQNVLKRSVAWNRKKTLADKYDITEEDHKVMYRKQRGRCAICKIQISRLKMHVDHDHETNKVRGLLCGQCNVGLGMFKDNVKSLAAAIKYLERGR